MNEIQKTTKPEIHEKDFQILQITPSPPTTAKNQALF